METELEESIANSKGLHVEDDFVEERDDASGKALALEMFREAGGDEIVVASVARPTPTHPSINVWKAERSTNCGTMRRHMQAGRHKPNILVRVGGGGGNYISAARFVCDNSTIGMLTGGDAASHGPHSR